VFDEPLHDFMTIHEEGERDIDDGIGWILARSLQAAASVETALDQYQTTRRDRTAEIIMGSRGQTNLYQKLTGDKTQQRAQSLDLVYGYDAVTGQLGIGG